MSMIPLTPSWWAARRANRALHNVRAMTKETDRARHLVKLVEAGLHEDALKEQMHDTEMDFGQFNRVKTAMSEHGQWRWQIPRHLQRTAEATGADRSKLESNAILRQIQREFRTARDSSFDLSRTLFF